MLRHFVQLSAVLVGRQMKRLLKRINRTPLNLSHPLHCNKESGAWNQGIACAIAEALDLPGLVPRKWQSHTICRFHTFVNVGGSSGDVEYAVARRQCHALVLRAGRIRGTQKSQGMDR